MKRLRTIALLQLAALTLASQLVSAQRATIHESPHKKLERSCEECHVPTSFQEIRFDHEETDYRLVGLHADVNCLACHNIENFSKVDRRCVTCHEDIHRDRMGVDCGRCHSPYRWTVFDAEEIHARTNFPIQGRHLLIDCVACHPGSPTADFRRAWRPCLDCHGQEYYANPIVNHISSGFSVLCQNCHEMTGWSPALMPDHDAWFPIFSGRHKNTWDTCSICHVDPNNFRTFECITCHEHNRTDMDAEHRGIPGYAYVSVQCYACHPTGEAGDFGEHDALFPIFSGKHNNNWDDCSTCHEEPDNRKVFTCLNCHEHNRSEMDGAHVGKVQDYRYESSACYECHPDGTAEEDRF
jgi:hypothetical protein